MLTSFLSCLCTYVHIGGQFFKFQVALQRHVLGCARNIFCDQPHLHIYDHDCHVITAMLVDKQILDGKRSMESSSRHSFFKHLFSDHVARLAVCDGRAHVQAGWMGTDWRVPMSGSHLHTFQLKQPPVNANVQRFLRMVKMYNHSVLFSYCFYSLPCLAGVCSNVRSGNNMSARSCASWLACWKLMEIMCDA